MRTRPTALALAGLAALLVVAPSFFVGAQTHVGSEFPTRLSKWDLFNVHGNRLEPREGVMPYDLNTALFSDYALKLRTLSVPLGTKVQLVNGELIFPVGTVVSKTFYYPRAQDNARDDRTAVDKVTGSSTTDALDLSRVQLLETRLLVNTESGWQALPYVWNDDQTDAVLALAGESFALTLVDERSQTDFDYMVPDANQCSACHAVNGRELAPIGLKVPHVNEQHLYPSGRKNQLRHWQDAGLLAAASLKGLPRTPRWDDPRENLNARARAYLDVNCGHCHSNHGAADNSGLLLDATSHEPIHLGICKPPVATGRGSGNDSFAIVPGSPRQSILLYRMQSTEPDIAMPELGRSLVHKEGTALISEWIRSLEGNCEN